MPYKDKEVRNAKQREYRQAHLEEVREYEREKQRRYRQDPMYQYKNAVRALVNARIKAGLMERPDHCEMCGCECKPHAHHPDYNRPLYVVFLCNKCHSKEKDNVKEPEGIEEATPGLCQDSEGCTPAD